MSAGHQGVIVASERDPLLPSSEAVLPAAFAEEHRSRRSSIDAAEDTADHDDGSRIAPRGVVAKLAASMFDFFVTGCGMAAIGVLIIDIERDYGTSDGTTAFIFPSGMLGYVCATASVEPISLRFGRRGIAILSPITRLLAALVLATEPPFGIVLAAYVCSGFGTGLTDTAWNTWASGLSRPNVWQGLLHGSFSLGCVSGPLIAGEVLRQHPWNFFYLVVVAFSSVELITQGLAFRYDGPAPRQHLDSLTASADSTTKPPSIFRNPAIWVCGAFYFLYQGVESTFTDWIVVFMIRARDASPHTAELASSTFWIGMTVGRYALGLVTEKFGVAMSVAAYIALAFCFQLTLNLVTSITATMILLAAIGFFVAPLFPSGIVLLVSRLPAQSHMKAVALLIALGQVGAAIAPLGVGFMADSLGIRHLFEVVCGLTVSMLVLWIVFARRG